jgi:asparagine synthase (glutamine-hydrolysing)
MQDILRGPELASLPFYDQTKVVALLESLPSLSPAECNAWDVPLMSILCACLLQKRFHV